MQQNITNCDFFAEQYAEKSIKINTTTNNNGRIEVDDNGNILKGATFTLGKIELGKLTNYPYQGKLLVFNKNSYDLYSQGENIDMKIDFENGTNYKINSVIETTTEYFITGSGAYAKNIFSLNGVNSLDHNLFKVFLNNTEMDIMDLYFNTNTITILGKSRRKLNVFGNSLVVIAYGKAQAISSEIEIRYMGVDKIISEEEMIDLSYFKENIFSTGYKNIISISETSDSQLSSTKRGTQNHANESIVSEENYLNVDQYFDSQYGDLKRFSLGDRFRFVKVGIYPTILEFYTNCFISPSSTFSFSREVDKMTFKLFYDTKESVLISDDIKTTRAYNDDKYNEHQYN